ncbi:hypothetical protein BJ742DRAFT_657206, partial [Cladochytrium replicatum]
LTYLAIWPDYFCVAESPSGELISNNWDLSSYGKAEGTGKLWHGHVKALTVAPEFRRLAENLMGMLEEVSEK